MSSLYPWYWKISLWLFCWFIFNCVLVSGFITCIRVLMRLLKPPHVSKFDEPKVNLSAVVKLFEASGYEIILNLIIKGLCESSNCYMWQSHQLMSRLRDETLESCFKLVTPLLQLLKLMIEQIASAADFHFRDMRVIKALLPLHAVMCSRYRLQNKFRHHVAEVQTLIADIFLIYAKGVPEEENNNGTEKKEFNDTEKEEEEDHLESDLERENVEGTSGQPYVNLRRLEQVIESFLFLWLHLHQLDCLFLHFRKQVLYHRLVRTFFRSVHNSHLLLNYDQSERSVLATWY